MSGIVYFRFKHQKQLDKIEFNSTEISVSELRLKIIEKLALVDPRQSANAVQLCRIGPGGEPGTVFEYDHELIPTHTTVMVLRVPPKQSSAAKKIVVETTDYLVDDFVEGDYLKLKESIIAEEVGTRKRCPRMTVCQLCSVFMISPDHAPMLLVCCGNTVCAACVGGKTNCPVEEPNAGAVGNFRCVQNRAVMRLVETVTKQKDAFIFDSVRVPDDFLHYDPKHDTSLEEAGETVIDLDEYEPEVFDVENPRPLTAKEKEVIERRERRKRKALEILMKREGNTKKVVKGELTEGEINLLLKSEVKAELHGLETSVDGKEGLGGDGDAVGDTGDGRFIYVEFPRLLTPDEFEKWKRQ